MTFYFSQVLGDSGGVVNSRDFCLASLKSLGCFYFRCVLSSQWKAVTVNLGVTGREEWTPDSEQMFHHLWVHDYISATSAGELPRCHVLSSQPVNAETFVLSLESIPHDLSHGNFTLPTLKAFLEARSQNVSRNKQ